MYKNEDLTILEMFIDEIVKWSVLHKASCAENYLGLAYMYSEGKGVVADPARAFSLFSKAALMGSAEAKHQLFICYYDGRGVNKNVFLAMKYLEEAAAAGYECAVNDLDYLLAETVDCEEYIVG